MKSRPRKRLTLDQRRIKILAAATRIFAHKGYDGASMSGIATAAGVTKPVLYDHFASKDALFETLLRSIRDDLLAKGQAIGRSSASEEHRFRAAVDAFFAFVENQPDAVKILLIVPQGNPVTVIRGRGRVPQGGTARAGEMVAKPSGPEPRRNGRHRYEGLLGGIPADRRQIATRSHQLRARCRGRSNLPKRQPLADVLKTYCLKSRCSLIGTAGGNMLSYMARASRTKRARSSSGFGINRMTSPIFAPNLIRGTR